jgi:hypothetical protein
MEKTMLRSFGLGPSFVCASVLFAPLGLVVGCGGNSGGTGGLGGEGGGVTSAAHTSSTTSMNGATTTGSLATGTTAAATTTTSSTTGTSSQSSTASGGMAEDTNALCMDHVDNDGDNLVDCLDPDCKAPALTACKENCTNGTDDDGDGKIDCADSTCNGMNGGPADAACTAVLIQNVQDGTTATGTTVVINKVFVTAVHVTAAGNVTLWVQEPQGITSGADTYPQYSGVSVFATTANAAMFTDMATIAVGDCVSLSGTTAEFNMRTEIDALTVFAKATTCGTAPTAYVIPSPTTTFVSVATDTDLVTMGDQPGTLTEPFEGVLVKVDSVQAIAAPDGTGDFRAMPTGGSSNLLIDSFIYGSALPATAGETFSSITGIYDQFKQSAGIFNYRLVPRTAADLAQ